MASTCFLQKLPQELLDMILARLSAKDQARLARCNRELFQRTLHLLYKPDAGNCVVEWAVAHGAIDTLRRAFAWGAPINMAGQPSVSRPTLTLALKHRQDDTFRFLLEQGAHLRRSRSVDFCDDSFIPLYNCLYTDRFDVVRRFIEAGLAVQILNHDAPHMLDLLLLRTVEKSTDYDVDQGDDTALDLPPQQDENKADRTTFSPLSHALLADRADLFSLLIEKGANINGPFTWLKGEEERNLPLHVPVADCDSRPMQSCIEHGANLAIRVPYHDKSRNVVSFTSPLAIFLKHIDIWGEKEHPNLIEKLEFLLIHGALSPDTIKPEKPRPGEIPSHGRSFIPPPRVFVLPSSCFDWLMKKRDAESRSKDHPALLSALKLLIRHGTSIESLTYSFREYHVLYRPPGYSGSHLDDNMIRHPPSDKPPKEGFDRKHWFNFWRELVETILESPQYHQSLDFFLYVYVLSKGPLLHKAPFLERDPKANGDKIQLVRQTIRQLVKGGAYIDRRGGIVDFRARLRDFQPALNSGDTVPLRCVHPPSQGCLCKCVRRKSGYATACPGATVLYALCYCFKEAAMADAATQTQERRPAASFDPVKGCFKFRPHCMDLLKIIVEEFVADPNLKCTDSNSISLMEDMFHHLSSAAEVFSLRETVKADTFRDKIRATITYTQKSKIKIYRKEPAQINADSQSDNMIPLLI
ncbi:hypothetical protein V8F06_000385 [Rhypophila decipiens]